MANAKNTRARRARSSRSRRKFRRARGPQTSLIDVCDALSTIGSVASVTIAALGGDEDDASQVLLEHVYVPLEKQRAIIEAHSKYQRIEHLARSQKRSRRKVAP